MAETFENEVESEIVVINTFLTVRKVAPAQRRTLTPPPTRFGESEQPQPFAGFSFQGGALGSQNTLLGPPRVAALRGSKKGPFSPSGNPSDAGSFGDGSPSTVAPEAFDAAAAGSTQCPSPRDEREEPEPQEEPSGGEEQEHSQSILDCAVRRAATPAGRKTTIMLKHMPNNYDQQMLLAMLAKEGFAGKYDFVYLPMDFRRNAGLGYAFVNLSDATEVPRFWQTFQGYRNWDLPTQKVCELSWSFPLQGLGAHVDRFRNSPVMHPSVPEHFKPMVFLDGQRVPFPPPTKSIKAPFGKRDV